MLFAFLVLLILRYIALLWFSYLNHLERDDAEPTSLPPVTILVPAYNEGAVIQGSIRSLLQLDYPRYEILVIDDGSKDDTTVKASVYAGDHGRANVRVITKPNGGKARALNTGISQATSDFILCMDGDSALHPQTLRRAIRHFAGPRHRRGGGQREGGEPHQPALVAAGTRVHRGPQHGARGAGLLPAGQHHPGADRHLPQERAREGRRLRPRHLRRRLRPDPEAAARGLAGELRARRDRLHRSAREDARPVEAALSLDAWDPAGDLEAQAPPRSIRAAASASPSRSGT